jgi:hypothetical protein
MVEWLMAATFNSLSNKGGHIGHHGHMDKLD